MNEFEQEVVEKLAIITTKVEAIENYQKQQNGRVFSLSDAVVHINNRLAERASQCPLVTKVQEEVDRLVLKMATAEAASANNKSWLSGLAPVLWLIAGAVGVLLVKHAGEWLPVLGK
jgi:hypothetical protein